jgi:hypothetical protein
MELLVFAIVAARNGYQQEETSFSAPAQFRPFDLHALSAHGPAYLCRGTKLEWFMILCGEL